MGIAQIAIYNYCFLQMNSNQFKCWFLVRGENWSTRGKTSHSRVENQQTQSTYDAECGNQTRATLVEGKCSRNSANPAIWFLLDIILVYFIYMQIKIISIRTKGKEQL